MSLPGVVSRDEWLVARKALLVRRVGCSRRVQLPDQGRARAARHSFNADGEQPGRRCFLRDGDRVVHSHSYARGLEKVGGSQYFLDETALGRREDWEEPKGRATDARRAIADFSS